MKLTVLVPVFAATLCLGPVLNSSAAPFDFYEIGKNAHFVQRTALAPTNSTEWLLSAHLCCAPTGGVTALTVATPSGQILEGSGNTAYFIATNFTTGAALNAAFPAGAYTFTATAGTYAPTSAGNATNPRTMKGQTPDRPTRKAHRPISRARTNTAGTRRNDMVLIGIPHT